MQMVMLTKMYAVFQFTSGECVATTGSRRATEPEPKSRTAYSRHCLEDGVIGTQEKRRGAEKCCHLTESG